MPPPHRIHRPPSMPQREHLLAALLAGVEIISTSYMTSRHFNCHCIYYLDISLLRNLMICYFHSSVGT
jgi:hypothetical protein